MVENLKRLRNEHGYSQARLAELLGISQQAVYKYENLSVEPDIRTLIQLADIFDVSVDYLIGRNFREVASQFMISADEAEHLSLWRTLPLPLRKDLDKIMQNYDIRPNKR